MKKNLRILSLLLALMMALCLVACTPAEEPQTDGTDSNIVSQDSEAGNLISITVDVISSDGVTTTFSIETDKETLRGALEQESLIQGEDGAYGLYITHVNGEPAIYETDGAYWAIYIGDEAATTGVDGIEITDGGYYKLVYTK